MFSVIHKNRDNLGGFNNKSFHLLKLVSTQLVASHDRLCGPIIARHDGTLGIFYGRCVSVALFFIAIKLVAWHRSFFSLHLATSISSEIINIIFAHAHQRCNLSTVYLLIQLFENRSKHIKIEETFTNQKTDKA